VKEYGSNASERSKGNEKNPQERLVKRVFDERFFHAIFSLRLTPHDGKGHRKAPETIFDEGIVFDTDFGKKGAQVMFREERHIITGGPRFADFCDKGIKILFGKKEVEEWDPSV